MNLTIIDTAPKHAKDVRFHAEQEGGEDCRIVIVENLAYIPAAILGAARPREIIAVPHAVTAGHAMYADAMARARSAGCVVVFGAIGDWSNPHTEQMLCDGIGVDNKPAPGKVCVPGLLPSYGIGRVAGRIARDWSRWRWMGWERATKRARSYWAKEAK